MENVSWLVAIFVGGLAGWLAGKFMGARFGIFMNIVLGIVGSVVANAVLNQFHIFVAGSALGYLITGFLGASLLLFVIRLVKK